MKLWKYIGCSFVFRSNLAMINPCSISLGTVKQSYSSHHQIVIWICFWICICQSQLKYQQIQIDQQYSAVIFLIWLSFIRLLHSNKPENMKEKNKYILIHPFPPNNTKVNQQIIVHLAIADESTIHHFINGVTERILCCHWVISLKLI